MKNPTLAFFICPTRESCIRDVGSNSDSPATGILNTFLGATNALGPTMHWLHCGVGLISHEAAISRLQQILRK